MISACYVICFGAFFFASSCYGKVIRIDQGALRGTEEHSRDGRLFHGFYGIPYAKPPVANLRFKPPQEPLSWNGTRNATTAPPVCSQLTIDGRIIGQEDCLYLNVFTPNLSTKNPLPVLVFIHGGVFRSRSADAGANFLMDKDVVFVTFNYRLGIFGFLSTGDEVIPGNYGLKDAIAVLKWVQRNIAHFGGDPNRVTLDGMSAGAICVHYLWMSPKAQGLFHRVILQSGSALSHWSHYADFEARNLTMSTIRPFNCGEPKSAKFLECLQNVSSYELTKTEEISENVFKFLPVVERADLEEAVIISPPAALTYYNTNITAMLGFTANEDDIFLSDHVKTLSLFRIFMLNQLSNFFIAGCLPAQFKYNSTIRNVILHHFRSKYFDNKYLSRENIGLFSDLMSDMSIVMPILDTALTYPGVKYLYMYNYTNPITASLQMQVPYRGAIHSDDGITLHSYAISRNLSAKDHEFSQKHVTYWTNFVTTGNPNANDSKLPKWEPVRSLLLEYLYLSNDVIRMKSEPFKERYEFWRDSGISVFDAEYYIAETPPSPEDKQAFEIIAPIIWLLSFFRSIFSVFSSADGKIWSWI